MPLSLPTWQLLWSLPRAKPTELSTLSPEGIPQPPPSTGSLFLHVSQLVPMLSPHYLDSVSQKIEKLDWKILKLERRVKTKTQKITKVCFFFI